MSEVRFNESLFPIVTTIFPNDLTDQDVVQCNKRVLTLMHKRVQFAIVNDFGQAQIGKSMQKSSAEFMQQYEHLFKAYIVGIAYVFRNPLQRAVARTHVMIYRPAIQMKMVATMAEGILQARDWLEHLPNK